MKSEIHPEYVETTVICSCGETFKTRSTKPEIKVEICSKCHPFFTGKQKLVDSGGRVQRFQDRYDYIIEEDQKESASAEIEERQGNEDSTVEEDSEVSTVKENDEDSTPDENEEG